MGASEARGELPTRFARAITGMRAVRLRPEIKLAEAPAPSRLAPFALALTADVVDAAGTEAGTGRFVALHDPAGQPTWRGDTRLVAYVRADLEPEMAADPFLTAVAWTWLTEALVRHVPGEFTELGGTVTRESSESYGTMASRPPVAQVELRVSWTPTGEELAGHLEAWADVLGAACGLAPLPPGVAALAARRRLPTAR